jgi:hypothetical protein
MKTAIKDLRLRAIVEAHFNRKNLADALTKKADETESYIDGLENQNKDKIL